MSCVADWLIDTEDGNLIFIVLGIKAELYCSI